jgi:acetoin utilization protein AcuB
MPHPRVQDYMTREPVTLHEHDPLREAVELVMVRRIRHIPILDEEDRLVGIVTDRDVKRTLPSPLSPTAQEEHEAILETTALHQVMTREPITITPEADIAQAVEVLVDSRIGGLPVLQDGALVGVFTEKDGLRAYLDLLKSMDPPAPGA